MGDINISTIYYQTSQKLGRVKVILKIHPVKLPLAVFNRTFNRVKNYEK
ncbi:MAG: hypothetical protein Q8O39_02410 [bacterium]|nr:hypothetical protein [bacterium]